MDEASAEAGDVDSAGEAAMTEPTLTMKEFHERLMKPLLEREIINFIDSQAVWEEMMKSFGPLKPTPWYKRWLASFGDKLIRLGHKLGGDY